jgi:hypothetical protein
VRRATTDNLDLRLQYLAGEITTEEWKIALQRREKVRQRSVDVFQMFDMFVTAGTDIMQKMRTTTPAGAYDILGELEALKLYVNRTLAETYRSYDNKVTMKVNFDRWYDDHFLYA